MRVATIVQWRCGPATGVGLMLPGLLAVLAVLAALAALAVLTARLSHWPRPFQTRRYCWFQAALTRGHRRCE